MSENTGLGGRARRRDGSCYTTGIVGAQHRGDRGGQGHGRGRASDDREER